MSNAKIQSYYVIIERNIYKRKISENNSWHFTIHNWLNIYNCYKKITIIKDYLLKIWYDKYNLICARIISDSISLAIFCFWFSIGKLNLYRYYRESSRKLDCRPEDECRMQISIFKPSESGNVYARRCTSSEMHFLSTRAQLRKSRTLCTSISCTASIFPAPISSRLSRLADASQAHAAQTSL